MSLIQISGGGVNYIFDPLLLDTVEPLRLLLENRSILKIFHGADYDVVSLKRDFKFQTGPLFDTALAARAIGIKQFSLQDLIGKYFQVKLIKKYQKSNWSARPLSKGHLDYAYKDTVYLERLYEILSDTVKKKDRWDQIEEECILIEKMNWNGKKFEPNDYLRVKGARALSEGSQKVLRELITARDLLAKERNAPPFKVVSSRHLIAISEAIPRDEAALIKLFPKGNSAIFKHLFIWLEAISRGVSTDVPLPKPEKRSNAPMTSKLEKLLKHLKQWRNRLAESEAVEPAMVLTANVLTEIVLRQPMTITGLRAISLIRSWQVQRYGKAILKEIEQWQHQKNTQNTPPATAE